MKMLWKKIMGSPVLSGVVSAIIIMVFFEPLLRPITDNVPVITKLISSAFVNFIYLSAATISLEGLAFYALLFLCSYYAATRIIKFIEIKPSKPIDKGREDKNSHAHQDGAKDEYLDFEEIKNQLNDLDEHAATLSKKHWHIARRLWYVAIALLTVCAVIFLCIVVIPFALYTSFKSSLALIAPYTDDATLKELISSWIRMRSYADYEAIIKIINEIRTAAGI